MTHPSILIILLNYRTPDMTLRAANAVMADMDQLNAEMIIVDNASGDGSFDRITAIAQQRGWTQDNRVRVMGTGQNGGFGAGNNFGIRQGLSDGRTPDFVYLLNSDAFIDPGALRVLLDFMLRRPDVGFAGSRLRGDDGAPHTTHFRFPTIAGEFEQATKLGVVTRLLAHAVIPMPRTEKPVQADWTAGASMLIRSDALRDIGLFDETFFLYFEETDLCRRGSMAGWQTWFVPQSTVTHVGSVSTGMKDWTRTPGYWFDSRRHYFLKNHGRTYLLGATVARATGAALWRLRRLVSPRPMGEPRWFLTDFLCHAIRANLPQRGSPIPAPYSQPLPSQTFAKDSK